MSSADSAISSSGLVVAFYLHPCPHRSTSVSLCYLWVVYGPRLRSLALASFHSSMSPSQVLLSPHPLPHHRRPAINVSHDDRASTSAENVHITPDHAPVVCETARSLANAMLLGNGVRWLGNVACGLGNFWTFRWSHY